VYIWSMNVWIDSSCIGGTTGSYAGYFCPVYMSGTRINWAGGLCPTIAAAPSSPHARIDLISLANTGGGAGGLVVTTGTAVTSPGYANIPATPAGDIPLYAVYVPYTATGPNAVVVDYIYQGVYPSAAYVYADLRPWCGY